jgi:hypothetical protein
MFFTAVFRMAKYWKQLKYPLADEHIKKMWHIYTAKYYLVTEKNKILSSATTWIKPEILRLNEINQELKTSTM